MTLEEFIRSLPDPHKRWLGRSYKAHGEKLGITKLEWFSIAILSALDSYLTPEERKNIPGARKARIRQQKIMEAAAMKESPMSPVEEDDLDAIFNP